MTPAIHVRPSEPAGHFDQSFTLQGVSVLVGLLLAVLTILGHGRKVRRENEADARERTDELKSEIRVHNDSVEQRLTKLETRVSDFMPRAEIEAKIEHEKGNRVQGQQSLKDIADRHARDIGDMRVSIGKIEQKQDSMAGDVTELKGIVRDFAREVNGKLDKQQECLTSISRRTA